MLEIMGLFIKFIWGVLSIPLTFDTFTFTIWQLMMLVFMLAFIVKLIFKSGSKDGD